MTDSAYNELMLTFKHLKTSGDYCDLIITCRGETYNVHKSVICTRSEFFRRAERFAVGKESAEGKIDLPEDDPTIIKLLIDYLYEGEYTPGLPDGATSIIHVPALEEGRFSYEFPHNCDFDTGISVPVCPHHTCFVNNSWDIGNFVCNQGCNRVALPAPLGGASQLIVHAKMYEIGDKYEVIGLKGLAQEKFLRSCCKYWDDGHFADAIHYAFTTTPEHDKGLRDVVCKVIWNHMEILHKPEMELLLDEVDGLAKDILMMRVHKIEQKIEREAEREAEQKAFEVDRHASWPN